MSGREVANAKEYRLRAQHCLDIARDMDSSRKVILLEMAQAWMRLADQAARNQKTDVVYETPTRPDNGDRTASRSTP